MITALVAILVVFSLGLIITVPVSLATPNEWQESKSKFNRAFQIWVSLILVIAAIDGISSSI